MLALGLMSGSGAKAALDNTGNEFWLAFPGNNVSNPTTSIGANSMLVFVTSGVATTGTIAVPGLGFSAPFTVAAGGLTQVAVPVNLSNNSLSTDIQAVDSVENKGVHVTVTTGGPVTVYGSTSKAASVDTFLGLPVTVLGTEYFAVSYPTRTGNATSVDGSQFAVVATENGTAVTVTPSVTIGARTAGVPYTITMNAGQTYQLRGDAVGADVSGSLITSDKPVAVFSGNRCAGIPDFVPNFNNTGTVQTTCDVMLEQLPPTRAWGKFFAAMPFATHTAGTVYRVIASTNGTNVTVQTTTGTSSFSLNRGEITAPTAIVTTSPVTVTSDKPVLVMEMMQSAAADGVTNTGAATNPFGDPSMTVVPPFEQFQGYDILTTPPIGIAGTPNFIASRNYINVISPANGVGAIYLDGTPIPSASFAALPCAPPAPCLWGATVNLPTTGQHIVTGQLPFGQSVPFGLFSYGYASAVSYANPGGMAVAPVADVTGVTLSMTSAVQYVGDQQCLTATANGASGGVPGVRIDFVSSVSGTTGLAVTDSAGSALFCFVGTKVGVEGVTGTVGATNTPGAVTGTTSGTVTWLPKPVTPEITANDKPYDQTTSATITSCSLAGQILTGQTVTCSVSTGTFASATVGNHVVTGSGITLSGPDAANYVLTAATATTSANITPIPVVPSVTAANKVYDQNSVATITSCALAGVLPGDNVTCTAAPVGAFSDASVANGKTVTATGITLAGSDAGNYTSPFAATTVANITPKPVDVTIPAVSKVYDGDAIAQLNACAVSAGVLSPEVVTCSGPATGLFVDANVGVSKPVSAVGVSLGGADARNYVLGVVTMLPADITPLAATITAGNGSKVYGAGDPALSATTQTGFLAGDIAGISLNSTRAAGENVGTYPTTPTATGGNSGNYVITPVNGTFTITKSTVTVTANPKTMFLGDPDPTFDFTYGPFPGPDGSGQIDTPPACSAAAHASTGSFAITCGGGVDNNYDFVYTPGTLTVLPKTATITAGSGTKVFGTVDPALSAITTTGFSGADLAGITLAQSRAAGENVGSYVTTATATGGNVGNYTVTSNTGLFTITKATATATATGGTFPYDGGSHGGTCTISDGLTGVLTYVPGGSTAPVSVGSYTVNCDYAGDGNHNPAHGTATITITPLAATVTAGGGMKVFGTADPALSAITTTGFSGADLTGITLAQSRAAGENVGSYVTTATATGGNVGNYTVTSNTGLFTITKATPTATATGGTFPYDGGSHGGTCTISGGLTGVLTYVPGGSTAPVNVGTYTVNCDYAGDANHNPAHASATITITPKAVTVTAGGGTKVYGTANPALTTTSTGFTTADLGGITLATTRVAGETVGSYVTTATATGGNIGNYTVTFAPGTFTITKAPLTVIANNKTKTQGAVNPALDGTLTGVVAGDGITATYSTTAVTASPVGSYPITPALADPNGKLGNYTVTITNGTLTVTGTGPVCVVVAVNDAYEVNKNQTLNIAAKGILRNDVDPYGVGLVVGTVNGAAAKVGVAVATAHGTVTVNANGGFTYKPATNYVGTDTFTYAAKSVYDNQVSAPATVTITIQGHYDGDGCDHDRNRNRHRDGDGCDHDKATTRHYGGDGCDHDRNRNGHRNNDGCDHDRDTHRAPSAHYTGDGDDHDRGRNGHREGDGCTHEQQASHHNDGDNCDHDRGINGHRDGDDCNHDREDSEHRDGDDCDHDRGARGHYRGDHCEHDSHHGDDDNTGTSGCLIQGGGQGRMTGGGTIGSSDARHGFELSCNANDSSNNLEVNWGYGNRFHLERLTSANCTKDPSLNAEHPSTSFNTYQGTGTGRFNGVLGATATWTFTDGGEPGRRDRATIVIKNAAGQVVLSVSGTISNGNQQAHSDRN